MQLYRFFWLHLNDELVTWTLFEDTGSIVFELDMCFGVLLVESSAALTSGGGCPAMIAYCPTQDPLF